MHKTLIIAIIFSSPACAQVVDNSRNTMIEYDRASPTVLQTQRAKINAIVDTCRGHGRRVGDGKWVSRKEVWDEGYEYCPDALIEQEKISRQEDDEAIAKNSRAMGDGKSMWENYRK